MSDKVHAATVWEHSKFLAFDYWGLVFCVLVLTTGVSAQERSRSKPTVYKGVSRCPWSVTWDAHVTPGDGEVRTANAGFVADFGS